MFPDVSEVKKRRQMLGLKQKQLANLAGVSQSLIAKLESGRVDPAYSKVRRIFDVLENVKAGEQKKAVEIMKKHILSAKPSDNLNDFAKKMKEKFISQVPVLKGDSNLGSISDDTLVRAMNSYGEKYAKLKVEEVMDPAFPAVDENTPIDNLKPILKFSKAVLITSKGKIVGIVSRSNLF
jgi:predicted transcriptional regulator